MCSVLSFLRFKINFVMKISPANRGTKFDVVVAVMRVVWRRTLFAAKKRVYSIIRIVLASDAKTRYIVDASMFSPPTNFMRYVFASDKCFYAATITVTSLSYYCLFPFIMSYLSIKVVCYLGSIEMDEGINSMFYDCLLFTLIKRGVLTNLNYI